MKKTKSKKEVLKVVKDKSKNYKPIKTMFSQLLLDRGVTLTEVSESTGISYPVLIDLKRGKRTDFNTRTLTQVAKYFNVDTNDIIDLTQNGKEDSKKTISTEKADKTDKTDSTEKATTKATTKKSGKKASTEISTKANSKEKAGTKTSTKANTKEKAK